MHEYPPMTLTEVRRARAGLGLSKSKFAKLAGAHVGTITKGEAGMQGVRTTSERLIRLPVTQATGHADPPRPQKRPRRR